MTIIGWIDARDVHSDVAHAPCNLDGMYAPYGYAAFLVDDTHVVCADCTTEEEREEGDVIFGDAEMDYPGYTCEDCGRWLDVTLLVYEQHMDELDYSTLREVCD